MICADAPIYTFAAVRGAFLIGLVIGGIVSLLVVLRMIDSATRPGQGHVI